MVSNACLLNGRKGKKKFEKFAEPLLHMAGFLVTTVKTERVNEAKELTGLIKKTNIIAVAGGDGTLSEVRSLILNGKTMLTKVVLIQFVLGGYRLAKTGRC